MSGSVWVQTRLHHSWQWRAPRHARQRVEADWAAAAAATPCCEAGAGLRRRAAARLPGDFRREHAPTHRRWS